MKTQLFLSFLVPALVAHAEVREQILVVVNNHIITMRTFQQAFEQERATLYRQYSGKQLDEKLLKDTRENVLQNLIDAFILEDRASEMKIVIPDEAVRERVEEIKKQNNLATDADLDKSLKASLGTGLTEYLQMMKRREVQQHVLGREIYTKVAVEEQEVRAYYEEHKEEFKQASRFRIRELMLSKGGNSEEQMTAMAKLERIQEALKKGKSFEELVKEYSVNPSKSTNGDLGWINKGMLREQLEKAALNLKPNQVSEPIVTEKDIYLVQLIAIEDEGVKPFNDVKSDILNKLREPKAQNAIQNYLQGLRVRANVRYMVPKETILKG